MLSNSVIAGAVASAYLTILILHLNPAFPLTIDDVVPLALVIGLAYGVNLAAVFYVLIVLRQLTTTEALSPGWLSVGLLSWLCTLAAGAAAIIMWLNLGDYSPVLESQTVRRTTAGAVTLSTSAVVFAYWAGSHRQTGRACQRDCVDGDDDDLDCGAARRTRAGDPAPRRFAVTGWRRRWHQGRRRRKPE
jgi:hypothetical protein